MDAKLILNTFNLDNATDEDFINFLMSKDFDENLKIKKVDISTTPEQRFVDDINNPKGAEGTKYYKFLVEFLAENKKWSPDLNREFNNSIIEYISAKKTEELDNRCHLASIADKMDPKDVKESNKFLDRYYKYMDLSLFEDLYKIDSLDFNKMPKSYKEFNNFKVFYLAPHVHNQFQEDKNTNAYKDFCEYKYNDFISQLESSKGKSNYAEVKLMTDNSKKIESKVSKNRDILNKIVRGEIKDKEDLDAMSL